ncbi:hypothetical protein Tco_1463733, partial [Tanacetum coccineum]
SAYTISIHSQCFSIVNLNLYKLAITFSSLQRSVQFGTHSNDRFDTESYLFESLLNRDTFMASSPKIDSLFEEFAGELTLIAPIPPGIVEVDFDPKGDIHFIENLMDDNSFPRPPENLKHDSETVIDSNNDYSSSDDDSPYSEDIDYVDALPPDPERQLRGEEKRSGNPTSYSGLSLPDYEAFYCDSEPDSGNFTIDVVEDIFDNPTREPRVYVPNVLPTHPTLYLDSNFTPFEDSLGSDLIVSFPSGTRNRIFDPGIFREVQSKRFLSPNEFSISFIRDPLSPVFDTLLLFSSENEEKDFNPGSLSSNEPKSPLFTYVVWIFLPFLMYPVAPPYLLSSENEDTVFYPDISIYHSFLPGVSHRSGTFMKFNVYPNHLNESPMEILSSTCFPMNQ